MSELHRQSTIWIGKPEPEFQVDGDLARTITRINEYGIETHESCQNYGEYLRSLEFDHIHEAQRDYAYIEFYGYPEAMEFLEIVLGSLGIAHPIHHRIMQEGTPGAWDLKARLSKDGHFWVWFPSDDIPDVERALDA